MFYVHRAKIRPACFGKVFLVWQRPLRSLGLDPPIMRTHMWTIHTMKGLPCCNQRTSLHTKVAVSVSVYLDATFRQRDTSCGAMRVRRDASLQDILHIMLCTIVQAKNKFSGYCYQFPDLLTILTGISGCRVKHTRYCQSYSMLQLTPANKMIFSSLLGR